MAAPSEPLSSIRIRYCTGRNNDDSWLRRRRCRRTNYDEVVDSTSVDVVVVDGGVVDLVVVVYVVVD